MYLKKKGTELNRGNFLLNMELKFVEGVKYSPKYPPTPTGSGWKEGDHVLLTLSRGSLKKHS